MSFTMQFYHISIWGNLSDNLLIYQSICVQNTKIHKYPNQYKLFYGKRSCLSIKYYGFRLPKKHVKFKSNTYLNIIIGNSY